MTDRHKAEAMAVFEGLDKMRPWPFLIYGEEGIGLNGAGISMLAAALSDAYEAGRREEREACVDEMEKRGAADGSDAILWGKDGMQKTAKIAEIRSRAFFDAAATIRSREDKA